MAQNHEDLAAEPHAQANSRPSSVDKPSDVKELDVSDEELGVPTADGEVPNEHEIKTLRHIGDKFPKAAYLVAVVEFCERFTFYGASGLFQNYISNSPKGYNGAKGLGLGHAGGTGLVTFFQFFAYFTPIFGAIIADQYLGKYKTILLFAGVYWVGLLLLWITALPVSVESGHATGGFIASLIIVALGTGGIKSNIAPLIADQYTRRKLAVTTLVKTGERVILDPSITFQQIYMMFYACINVGCLALLATPFMELYAGGFWSAYLLAFCMFCIAIVVLVLCRHKYIVRPPNGTVITDSLKAIMMMIKNRNLDAPKPSWREANGKTQAVPWNDHFIDELQRAPKACKFFCLYPVFWVCCGQFNSNFIAQAKQMEGHGMPNDLMQNFDPISIIVFIPILDRLVYPLLRKMRIELKPIARICIGFFLASCCLAYAAIVQHVIYSSGPCYVNVGKSPEGMDGKSPLPNHVHIALQTPAYIFIGVAEIFISVTGLEYAYTKAPPSMKSFVQSIYLFTNALGSALNEALVPATGDPAIMYMYTGVSCLAAVTSVVCWLLFHHYDRDEQKMNELDANDSWDGKPGEENLGNAQLQERPHQD